MRKTVRFYSLCRIFDLCVCVRGGGGWEFQMTGKTRGERYFQDKAFNTSWSSAGWMGLHSSSACKIPNFHTTHAVVCFDFQTWGPPTKCRRLRMGLEINVFWKRYELTHFREFTHVYTTIWVVGWSYSWHVLANTFPSFVGVYYTMCQRRGADIQARKKKDQQQVQVQ